MGEYQVQWKETRVIMIRLDSVTLVTQIDSKIVVFSSLTCYTAVLKVLRRVKRFADALQSTLVPAVP